MSNPHYQAFAFVPPTAAAAIERAEEAIRIGYAAAGDAVSITRRGANGRGSISVSIRGYVFVVSLGPDYGMASEVVASVGRERPDRELIASCTARFEVTASELDDALLHHHDYEQLVHTLEATFGAIAFEPGTSSYQTRVPGSDPSRARADKLLTPAATPATLPTNEEKPKGR